MNPIAYFKLQAKNLLRDYKTKKPSNAADGYCEYDPEYFDIDGIFLDYDWDEENFSLMKAQHLIAQMVGFRKWTDLLKASETEQELAKLLFDNQHKISIENWEMYIDGVERENNTVFEPEFRLEIFTQVFLNVEGHHNPFADYRLDKRKANG